MFSHFICIQSIEVNKYCTWNFSPLRTTCCWLKNETWKFMQFSHTKSRHRMRNFNSKMLKNWMNEKVIKKQKIVCKIFPLFKVLFKNFCLPQVKHIVQEWNEGIKNVKIFQNFSLCNKHTYKFISFFWYYWEHFVRIPF